MNTLVLIWGILDEHAGSNLANTRNSTPTNCVQLIFESQLLKKTYQFRRDVHLRRKHSQTLFSSALMFTSEETTLGKKDRGVSASCVQLIFESQLLKKNVPVPPRRSPQKKTLLNTLQFRPDVHLRRNHAWGERSTSFVLLHHESCPW